MTPTDLDKILQQRAAESPRLLETGGGLRSFSLPTKQQKVDFWLGVIFLFGVFLGTMLVNRTSAETQQALDIILGSYLKQRQVESFSGIVGASFSSLFTLLALLFFCGFCTIAQPVIFFIPFFRGLGYGFSIGTLYAQHGTDAIPYVVVMILPAMLLGTFLLIIASRISIRFSLYLLHNTMHGSEPSAGERSRRYCIRFLLLTFFCLLVALFDAGLCFKFSRLFIL